MSICILADAAGIDRSKQIELEYMSFDGLNIKGVFIPRTWAALSSMSKNNYFFFRSAKSGSDWSEQAMLVYRITV
jgi:hypothetical protein